jgi:hypothetical protein
LKKERTPTAKTVEKCCPLVGVGYREPSKKRGAEAPLMFLTYLIRD